MKTQVVLDERSRALLERLAKPRGNNRSFVVREALRAYAAMEDYLDELEKDPAFRRHMSAAEADVRGGRLIPHEKVVQRLRRRRK